MARPRRSRAAALPALACALALALGACGGDRGDGGENGEDGEDRAPTATAPATATTARPPALAVDAPVPPGLRGAARRTFVEGRRLTRESGCLACHRIGAGGNDGPGTNLTGVGARLPAPAIRRALLDPAAPMPSYRELARAELDALTAFLAALDGGPGGSSCPDEGDCG